METIEERAKAYEDNYPKMDDFHYSYYVYDGYVKGATEQRKIDIEKVYHTLEKVVAKEILDELRKVMED